MSEPIVPEEKTERSDYETIFEKVGRCRTILVNGQLPEIQSLMDSSYPKSKMAEGVKLLNIVDPLISRQVKEFGESVAATAEVEKLIAPVSVLYMRHVKFGRIAFEKNPEAMNVLQLAGRRKKTIFDSLGQMKVFYINLLKNPEWVKAYAEFGISQDSLGLNIPAIAEVEVAYAEQQRESGESTTATYERDCALENLFDWVSRYKKVARITLEGYPKWLEKLGM